MYHQFQHAECNAETGASQKLSPSPEYCGAWRKKQHWVIVDGHLRKDLRKGVMVVCRRWGQSYINPLRSRNTGLDKNRRNTIEAAVTLAFTHVFGTELPKNQGNIKTELVKSVFQDTYTYYDTFIKHLSDEVQDSTTTIASLLTKEKFAGFFGPGVSWVKLLQDYCKKHQIPVPTETDDASDEIVPAKARRNLADHDGGRRRRHK